MSALLQPLNLGEGLPKSTGQQNRSILGLYAAHILREEAQEAYGSTHDSKSLPEWHFPRETKDIPSKRSGVFLPPPREIEKVCIIGAGVAGLQLARLCAFSGIDYEILEASDRVGGRVYTHQFPNTDNPHNYYDVGAMRFPKLKIMEPVFDLFEEFQEYVKLENYYLSNPTNPNLFYNTQIESQDIQAKTKPWDDAVQPFIKALEENFDTGLKMLMLFDNFTVRQYLTTQADPPLSFDEIQTLETYASSTGMFDEAFTEAVLGYYIFHSVNRLESAGEYPVDDLPGPQSFWVRIAGGTEQLTNAMYNHGHNGGRINVQMLKRVNAIEREFFVDLPAERNIPWWYPKMLVHVDGESEPRKYSAVFNTTSLGCLNRMDLSRLPLSQKQQTAIRSLAYNPSCKIGVKFSRPWWTDFSVTEGGGGSSSTDRSIRTAVYPSWFDGNDTPAVMIVSYSHARDAAKWASLINQKGDPDNKQLLDLVLRDLVELYADRTTPSGERLTFKHLKSLVMSYHAHDWNQCPNTAGAFAHFGPGQFKHLYKAICTPAAGGTFFIVGECSSVFHGWILGALDSAIFSFIEFLESFGQWELLVKYFQEVEHNRSSFAHIPDEMDETVLYHLVALEVERAEKEAHKA